MPRTLFLPNGRYAHILRDKDFEDLIAKYMGDDAADYYKQQIKACLDYIDELDKYSTLDGYYWDIPQGSPKEFRHEHGFE